MAVVGFIPVFAMFAYITNGVFDSNYRQYITEMSLNNVGKMNLLDYILFRVYVFWENSLFTFIFTGTWKQLRNSRQQSTIFY